MDKQEPIGRRIHDLRYREGWRTQDLAKILTDQGIPTSRRTVEGWEQDRKYPRVRAAAALRRMGL